MYIIKVRSTQYKLDQKGASAESPPTSIRLLRRTFRLRRTFGLRRLLGAGEVEACELQESCHSSILVRPELPGGVSWVYFLEINGIPSSFGWAPVAVVRSVKVLDAVRVVDHPVPGGPKVSVRIIRINICVID